MSFEIPNLEVRIKILDGMFPLDENNENIHLTAEQDMSRYGYLHVGNGMVSGYIPLWALRFYGIEQHEKEPFKVSNIANNIPGFVILTPANNVEHYRKVSFNELRKGIYEIGIDFDVLSQHRTYLESMNNTSGILSYLKRVLSHINITNH